MKNFHEGAIVGLREKDTGKLIAVYPDQVSDKLPGFEKKVFDWYYKQDCSAEDRLRNYYVDELTDSEVKAYRQPLAKEL